MMTQAIHRLTSFCLGAFVLLGLSASISAQEEEDGAWRDGKAKLEKMIDQRATGNAKKIVTPQKIAERLRWKWPVKPPKQTLDEVEKSVAKRIETEVDQQHPMGACDKFPGEAAAKYTLREKNDKVSFIIRGGLGPNTLVKGRLRQVTELFVLVGSRRVVRSDMSKETLALFDPVVNAEFKERYIRAQTNRYNAKRRGLAEDLGKKYYPATYAKSGYVSEKRHRRSIDKTNWKAKSEILDRFYQGRLQQQVRKLRPGVEQEVFTANGYVQHEGEWMPKKVADSLAAKLKALVKEDDEEDFEDDFEEGEEGGADGAEGGEETSSGPGEPGMMGEGGMGGEPGMGGESGMGGEGMMGEPGMGGEGMMGEPGMGGGKKKKKKKGKGGGGNPFFDEAQ
jgi:hypothetical protein